MLQSLKLYTIFVIILLCVINCIFANKPAPQFSEDDAYTILSALISNELSEKSSALHGIFANTNPIVICYENTKCRRILEINGMIAYVLSKSDIAVRADSIGPFLYFNFKLDYKSGNEIIAELTIQWVTPKDFEILELYSGDGIGGIFREENNKWIMVKPFTIKAAH